MKTPVLYSRPRRNSGTQENSLRPFRLSFFSTAGWLGWLFVLSAGVLCWLAWWPNWLGALITTVLALGASLLYALLVSAKRGDETMRRHL